ncbi:lysophospholipase [Streptomyces sp. NPDC050560]|uniref:lysophospholipase n=1 Tax=Streptomyces sp. NPDC050560 TaxID=3365630 RepID=UPI00378C7490
METAREHTLTGTRGRISLREWHHRAPRRVVLLVHGYGEHTGRYGHVARALLEHGCAVFAPDHMGHGRSDGERVLIEDFEDVVVDVRTAAGFAGEAHPGVPLVMLGHSMGGMIAARYAQRYGSGLAGLVLTGPVLGRWEVIERLLPLAEIPDEPIDTATLSRDPAVGAAYAADPLVWHGPFRPATVRAFDRALRRIAAAGPLGALPTLWVHGEDDRLVPLDGTRPGVARLRGSDFTERLRPGARHEVLNETDRDEVLAEVTAFLDRLPSR